MESRTERSVVAYIVYLVDCQCIVASSCGASGQLVSAIAL